MASRTILLPRNENDTLLTPPLTSACGSVALIWRVASMKVEPVTGVLFDAGRDGENIRIENDVGRIEANLLGQHRVRALADADLALDRIRLPLLVERHDDHGSTVVAAQLRLPDERVLAFLEADRIHDRLALHALQARFDNRPLRRIDHDRHARDVRFGRDEIQESDHRLLRIEHALVHVDVDDLRAVLDLLARDRDCSRSSRRPRSGGGKRPIR